MGPQDVPRTAQEAPKMRQDPPKSCPRGVQEAAHMHLGAKTRHRIAPDPLQTSILQHFVYDFGITLDGFLERILEGF